MYPLLLSIASCKSFCDYFCAFCFMSVSNLTHADHEIGRWRMSALTISTLKSSLEKVEDGILQNFSRENKAWQYTWIVC